MSKTTFFKRIALTAIAALGFGMLSVAPSQAVAGTPTITVATGSASVTSGKANETTTAATITVTALVTATTDTYSVSVVRSGAVPTGGSAVAFRLAVADTTTSVNSKILDNTDTNVAGGPNLGVSTDVSSLGYDNAEGDPNLNYESTTTFTSTGSAGYQLSTGAAPSEIGGRWGILVDSSTTRVAGTYTFTVLVQAFNNGAAVANGLYSTTVTFTINDTAANTAAINGTIDPSKTTAFMSTAASPTADGDVNVVATASNTTRATIRVKTMTSTSLQAPESVTVTITGPGLVGTDAGVYGKSITTAADGDDLFLIRSDGTAGTASIVIKTTTVTFPAKTVTFYAKAAKTITLEAYQPVVAVGAATSDVVRATITDADGINWGGTAYIYSADPTIASSATPAACTYVASLGKHQCPVQGKLKGSASLKVIDASTVATANVTSDAVSIRVSTGVATTAKISFDKATYAPGEKAQLRVAILDQEGLAMPAATITAAFAAALTSNVAFGAGSDALTSSADVTLSGSTSAAANTNAGHKTYVVYMPMQGGTVTVSGLGSTGLAAAGRVAVSGSATVVDTSNDSAIAAADAATDAASEAIDAANAATDAANLAAEAADAATVAAEEARDAADAATAAVEALATEVATLMAALKAQITTLANTVAKIAKKVKA